MDVSNGDGRRQVVETAGQLRWWALAAIVFGAVLAAIGQTFGVVLGVAGVVVYVVMQYIAGRYE